MHLKIDYPAPRMNQSFSYPPASEVSSEAANLTVQKNLHTPVYSVKQSVCLWSTLTPIIPGLAKQNGPKKIHLI